MDSVKVHPPRPSILGYQTVVVEGEHYSATVGVDPPLFRWRLASAVRRIERAERRWQRAAARADPTEAPR